MEQTLQYEQPNQFRQKAAKPLVWAGIASIVMLFAGLTSAYSVSKGSSHWVDFDLPSGLYYSTAILIASSLSLFVARMALKRNHVQGLGLALIVTLLLSFSFVFSQVTAWGQLVESGFFFAGKNTAASYLYVFTGLHLLHLFGGLIALGVVSYKSFAQRYDAANMLGFEVFEIYWHFLTALWVYLMLFLLYIS